MEDYKDTLISFGGAIKATRTDEGATLGGYLVRFSTPTDADLTGDFFTKDTDLGVDDGDRLPVYFHHGMDGTVKNKRLGKGAVKVDEVGMWLEAQLAMRDEYEKMIVELAEQGKLGWSSGAASHLVSGKAIGNSYEIEVWPIGEASLTPTPAEPRNSVIPLKSLLSVEDEEPQEQAQETEDEAQGAGDAPQSDVNSDGDAAIKSNPTQEITDMNENENEVITMSQEQLDETIEAAANAAAVKALAALPPIETGGDVVVTDDPADREFGSIAEQLSAVKTWTLTNGQETDPRLLRIKATGASEGVPSDGGFLLEPTLSSEIVKPIHEEGPFARAARKLPVGNNSNYGWINGVDETSRADGSRWGGIRGYWLAEAGTKTASKPKFSRLNWELKKVAVLCYATDELLQDSAMFSEVLRQGAGEELMFMVNDAIVNGDGAGKPVGLLSAPGKIAATAETGQAATTIVFENLPAMWKRLHARSKANAFWSVNPDTHAQLAELYLSAGTAGLPPRFVTYGNDGIMRIYGRPVIETEFNQTLGTEGDIILADMSQYLFWDRQVQAASSIHVQFLTDETVFRFVYRCDGMSAWSSALTPKYSAVTVSPIVTLATRS